jgi:hypothetical protein
MIVENASNRKPLPEVKQDCLIRLQARGFEQVVCRAGPEDKGHKYIEPIRNFWHRDESTTMSSVWERELEPR